MDNVNVFNGEIKLIKGNINTKDDFLTQIQKKYEKGIIDNKEAINVIILIKNYLSSLELQKIFVDCEISYCVSTLTKLNLTANNLNNIPEVFLDMKNMKQLILNNNKIVKIENLNNMPLLERLELRGNKIETIENLDNNKEITILTLSSNLIKTINKGTFPHLDKVTEFGLFGNFIGDENNDNNNISIFTDTMSIIGECFPNIKSIYIGGNFISQINTLNENIKKHLNNIEIIDGHKI